jgi:hypothetical protein
MHDTEDSGVLGVVHGQAAGSGRQEGVEALGSHPHQRDESGGKIRDRRLLELQSPKDVLQRANHLQ